VKDRKLKLTNGRLRDALSQVCHAHRREKLRVDKLGANQEQPDPQGEAQWPLGNPASCHRTEDHTDQAPDDEMLQKG
jgi:hypothetical protein